MTRATNKTKDKKKVRVSVIVPLTLTTVSVSFGASAVVLRFWQRLTFLFVQTFSELQKCGVAGKEKDGGKTKANKVRTGQ